MTTFSRVTGTTPPRALERFKRSWKGNPNDGLFDPIVKSDAVTLQGKIANRVVDIDDPVFYDASIDSKEIRWRSPLELAVDKGANADIVAMLLEAGANITLATLQLAIAGAVDDWTPRRTAQEFENAEKIVAVLSAAGADWKKATIQINEFKTVYVAQPLVDKIGQDRAAALGVVIPAPGEPTQTADDFIAKRKTAP